MPWDQTSTMDQKRLFIADYRARSFTIIELCRILYYLRVFLDVFARTSTASGARWSINRTKYPAEANCRFAR